MPGKGKKRGKAAAKPEAARPATAPAVNNSQVLPAKEAALFKQIARFYETKQYKKGLKAADQILKNHPLHGETLAMKGLTCNCMDKKEEALALVKKGVAMNIKSHVCWHVYGLLYRSDQKYNDAVKCYQNALRMDPGNTQILRDLSLLQIQRRMYEGFTETRRQILLDKTNNRNNWIAYALGMHLDGKHKQAIGILDNYAETQDERQKQGYEYSEMHLYKNMILTESGDLQGALAHLEEVKKHVVDKFYIREHRGALLVKLGRAPEAERDFRALLSANPENHAYHYQLAQALGITNTPTAPDSYTAEQSSQLVELYQTLAVQFPRCAAVQRLPLNFLSGAAFEAAADAYLQTRLRKGVPSLFRDMRALYKVPEKVGCISALLEQYASSLAADRRFRLDQEADQEAPSALVWVLYYQAQHLDYMNESVKALAVADRLIQHSPTLLDSYVLKARILKHGGDVQLAWLWMDQARRMDTADRYLNTKCTRYALRAGDFAQAEETVALFLREGDSLSSLFDMQCAWYENTCGDAHVEQKSFGKALKQYVNVTKHFHDMEEDQFDFHSYCLRKMTLRSYVKMMRMEDSLKSHRFFVRAARGIVSTYLTLHDLQKATQDQQHAVIAEASAGSTDPAEQRRLEKAAKRKAAKKAAQAAAAQQSQAAETQKEEAKAKSAAAELAKKKGKEVDPDPHGEALLAVADPLAEALKYTKELLLYSYDDFDSHIKACQVYSRAGKYLLWLRSLKRCFALRPAAAQALTQTITFLAQVAGDKEVSEAVQQVIQAERASLHGGQSVAAMGTELLTGPSLEHRFGGLVAGVESAEKALLAFPLASDAKASHKACSEVLRVVESKAAGSAVAFKAMCLTRFPTCPAFMSEEGLAAFRDTHKFVDPLTTYITVEAK